MCELFITSLFGMLSRVAALPPLYIVWNIMLGRTGLRTETTSLCVAIEKELAPSDERAALAPPAGFLQRPEEAFE